MARRRRVRRGDPGRAVAYLRVNTSEQHLGPEAQRAAIAGWAEREGVVIVGWHKDHGISGGADLDKRPALIAALDALETHGAGILVAAKRDRLARGMMNCALIERMAERVGARAVAIDDDRNVDSDDPDAFIRRRIKDMMAEYERLLIRSRTKAALAVKKARGERTGDIPIGKRLDDDGIHLSEDSAETEAVARIHELRTAGFTIRGIAEQIGQEGFKPRGHRWHKTTIDRILNRAVSS